MTTPMLGGLGPPRGALPSYAAGARNTFDGARSLYNGKASNQRNLRRAIGAAAVPGSGVVADVVWIGDSLPIGWNDSAYNDAASVARSFAAELATLTGLPLVGTGVVPCVAGGAAGVPSDRWSSTGTVDFGTGFSGICIMFPNSTISYTSLISGTVAQVFYGDQATGFTWQVDGGAARTVNPGGTSAVKMDQLTGLANTVHTIKITAPGAGNPNIYGVGVDLAAAQGLRVHNLCLGGSTCATGGAITNWNDASNFYGFGPARRAMIALAGAAPAAVLCSIGGNDLTQLVSTLAISAGVTSMRGFWPAADFVRLLNYTDSTNLGAPAYLAGAYALADLIDIPMIDWQHRLGDRAGAAARGDLGALSIHPTFPAATALGKGAALAVAA